MYGHTTEEVAQLIKNNRSQVHKPTNYAANHFSCYFQLFFSQLGMKDMFQTESADFSGITGSRDLHVSHVLQKTFVEVTELGTEAGASSGESVSKLHQFVVQSKVHNYMKLANVPTLQTDYTWKTAHMYIFVPTPQLLTYNFCSNILRSNINTEATCK
jgi:hypothetical protein